MHIYIKIYKTIQYVIYKKQNLFSIMKMTKHIA